MREANNSIRLKPICLQHKLRFAEIDVKENVLISFCKSLTIYFGISGGRHLGNKDIDAIDLGYFHEIISLSRDLIDAL